MNVLMQTEQPCIWLVANQGAVGGGEVMLLHLAEALRELGRPVSVIAPRFPTEVADLMARRGFSVERISGETRVRYMLGLFRGVWRRRGAREVLWCNGLLPAVALSGRPRRVVHLHQLPTGRLQRALVRLARFRARATVVPSRWLAGELRGSAVLPNWVSIEDNDFREEAGSSSPEPAEAKTPLIVGYMGRLSVDKGVLDLIEAVRRCETTDPGSVEARLAGDSRFVPAPQAQMISNAAAAAGDCIRMLGWVEREVLLREIDLLVVPSIWPESFGLVAAEAMAAGVPVLVSDAGALPEVVGRDHPLIYRAGDPGALADALARASQLDRPALIESQRARWAQNWSPVAGRRRLQELLAEREI